MAVFTPVSLDQVAAWLKNYSIGAPLELKGIPSGIENSNFFLTTTHGQYVLTLFEKLTRSELPFYIHLMAHLARHGIPCPAPIADRDNEYLGQLNGKPAAIVSRLSGASDMSPGIAHCAAIGGVLADMHVAGQSYGRRLDNPRGPRWWRETAPQVMPFLTPDEQAMLADELRFQGTHRHDALPRGVVHADLFRDNCLFATDTGAPRVGGIIDFYFAGNDVLLFDVAVTVNDWCSDASGELDTARARALLDAYHSIRPLSPAEHKAWPAMLRGAALRFWLSRLYDFHLPRPGEIIHAHDPARFRDILKLRIAAGSALPWPV
ncbi:MAG: homoserine kinase [Rhodocyclaceae bacterium]|jgi:homoserine kinase type II|nr:MAG: homoserine kinase [Rhodocyclaceae bacterium]